MRVRILAAALLLVLAGSATAAITVRSIASVTLSVSAPPVVFDEGAGASHSRYVSDVAVTPNGTSFAATITGRLGGDSTVKSVVTLSSTDSAARTVTLSGTQVTNVNVPIHTWTIRSGGATIATLDMRAASPSASFSIPSGATYDLDLRVKVIKGVAANDASFTSTVWGVVS